MQKWELKKADRTLLEDIENEFDVSAITAMALLTKGLEDIAEIDEFLSDNSDFTDPFLIKDMDAAVKRILDALDKKEKICIYGDYDADGVTSTSMLYLYLKSLWADVSYYIPQRLIDGYGLNNAAIDKLAEQGVQLIITVDNGISCYAEVEHAKELGIDVVVTDHHKPPERIPDAAAVVDPHRLDDESGMDYLCGAGVVLKLIMALESDSLDIEDILDRYAAICSIGTVADVVSLVGENRMIVKEGLRRINEVNDNIGIRCLRELAGIGDKKVTSTSIGFILAPRINAGGRVDIAKKAVELLLSEDEEKARELAKELCDYNAERKRIEQDIITAARKVIDENEHIRNQKILVVDGEGWHKGVVGIAAARIRETYGKPTLLISYEGDEAGGSARSIEGFPMVTGITYCKELMTFYGGHPMAAGMTFPTSNIEKFREMINEYADTLDDDFFPTLEVTAKLNPGSVGIEDVQSLSRLEPFGKGNEKPVFCFGNVTITRLDESRSGNSTKITFKRGEQFGVAYKKSTPLSEFPYKVNDVVNIAVDFEVSEFDDRLWLMASVKDIMFTGDKNPEMLKSKRDYEQFMLGKRLPDEDRKELIPTRDDFAVVYRYLKGNENFKAPPEVLLHRLGRPEMSLGKLLTVIKAMEQLKLIGLEYNGANVNITPLPVTQKVDLESAPVIRALNNT